MGRVEKKECYYCKGTRKFKNLSGSEIECSRCYTSDIWNECHDLDTEYIEELLKPLREVYEELEKNPDSWEGTYEECIMFHAIKQVMEGQ